MISDISNSMSASSNVGAIWTGHDWTDTANGIKVVDGVPSGTTPEVTRRLNSPKAYTGDAQTDYLTLTNVKLVHSFFSQDDWNTMFPDAISLYTYDAFLQAVGEFPMFCQEGSISSDDNDSFLEVCKREVSTFLAHVIRETVDLKYITEINCTPPEHNDPPEAKCDYKSDATSASTTLWPPVDDV